MTTRVRARVTLVTSEKRGGVLAAAASIGDETLQVRDAGDFAADDVESGTLLVDDDTAATLEFTSVDYVEDDDPSDLDGFDTIHLAAPLEAAIEEGTNLWVWEEPDDGTEGIVEDVTALCVPEDDEDAVDTGEQIEADVPRDFQDDLLPGRQAGRGVKVVLEWDDDVEEWSVARIRGKGSRAIQFEHAEPAYTPTSDELTAGVFTRQLSHRNIAPGHGMFMRINAGLLGSEWWELIDPAAGIVRVTIPDYVADCPPDYREFGWPMYAYRRGIAVDPPEVEPVTPTWIVPQAINGGTYDGQALSEAQPDITGWTGRYDFTWSLPPEFDTFESLGIVGFKLVGHFSGSGQIGWDWTASNPSWGVGGPVNWPEPDNSNWGQIAWSNQYDLPGHPYPEGVILVDGPTDYEWVFATSDTADDPTYGGFSFATPLGDVEVSLHSAWGVAYNFSDVQGSIYSLDGDTAVQVLGFDLVLIGTPS